jgi:hypothetical protein
VVEETSMATIPSTVEVQQARISPFGRIFGVLFSPKKTYEDIVRKPDWILPLVLSTVLSLIAVTGLNQKMNWREYVSQKIEANPRAANLSPEQKASQAEISAKVTTYIVYASGLLVPILFALIVGLVMMGAYNILGGAGVSFKQSFSILAYTGVIGLLSTPLFLLVLFLKPPGTIDPENPLATNLAAFLPPDSAKWLLTLGKSIDIFTFWILILIAIGFATVNPKKLRGAKSFAIAFGVFFAYVVIRVGIAFIFS